MEGGREGREVGCRDVGTEGRTACRRKGGKKGGCVGGRKKER